MENEIARARAFVTLLKAWLLEARTRCNEVEDPEECRRTAERLMELIKKFERLIKLV